MNEESNSSTTRDIIDAVTGVAEAVPIYDDLVQPAAKELGKGLQTVAKTVNVCLAPLKAIVWGYEKIEAIFIPKVEARLKDIPPENIVTPKLSVAGPIMEALRYTGSEETLTDLYANLLAASMDKTTATTAHPAFTEIIRQLTPDEAKLIALFPLNIYMPLIDIRRVDTTSEYGQFKTFVQNYSSLGKVAGCEHLDLVPAYLDNLVRLGLVEIPEGTHYTDAGVYDELENSELAQAYKKKLEEDPVYKCEFGRKIMRTTSLGRQFAEVCVKKRS